MARRKAPPVAEGEGFGLTPMIDITFQLIIFFMLVTDMSNRELEQVTLPLVTKVVEDEFQDKHRITINIDKDGHIKIRRKSFKTEALRAFLEAESRLRPPDPTTPGASSIEVLIRADGRADYSFIQDVMQACGRSRIWKIQCGAEQDP